jgi:DNA-binding NarL/FixJ family response regulator
MSKKRVMLVDDSEPVRRAVRVLFDSHPRFEVCGEAEHGREAVEKALGFRPDLIILDMVMPVMNGLEAAPLLFAILPNVYIILFSAHDNPEVQRLSQKAGIHAVVPKSKAATHLVSQAHALLNLDSAA